MRKCGYNKSKDKDSIAYADKLFHFLEWLQDKYNKGLLVGNFHSNNIIKEIWNKFIREADPLQSMHSFNTIYNSFDMYFTANGKK